MIEMKKRIIRVLIPAILGVICITLGISFSLVLFNQKQSINKINYVLCSRKVISDDFTLTEEYRVYTNDQDYLDKVKTVSVYAYRSPELFQQYRSQLLLDESVQYIEKPEENKIVISSETAYYYDEEIVPTLYLDYIDSLEKNQFQCNN